MLGSLCFGSFSPHAPFQANISAAEFGQFVCSRAEFTSFMVASGKRNELKLKDHFVCCALSVLSAPVPPVMRCTLLSSPEHLSHVDRRLEHQQSSR